MNKKWRLLLLMQDGWDYTLEKEAQCSAGYTGFVHRMLLKIDPVDYKRLLLIGACYTEIILLQNERFDVTGIGLAKKTCDDVKYYRMDMHDIKFPPQSFDAIAFHGTFEHGMSVWLMVAEIRRVLRLGGRCYLDTPLWNDETHGNDALGWFSGMNRSHSNFLHPNQLKHVFRDMGFKLIYTFSEQENKHSFVFEKLPVEESAHVLVKPLMEYEKINEPLEEITKEKI